MTFLLMLIGTISILAQTITVGNGQTLNITTNTTYTKLTVSNGGTLNIISPATLTVGISTNSATTSTVIFEAGSTVNVNTGASLVVYGLLNNDKFSDQVLFNGSVFIYGNYYGGKQSTIDGYGTFNATGSMITDDAGSSSNSGTVYGNSTDCNTGPCSGNNLSSSGGKMWLGTTSTDWNDATNWYPATIPTLSDDIIILSFVPSGRMPVVSTNANAKSIANNGTLIFTSSGNLNVYGNITNSGTFTTVTGSTISFNGTTAQSINGVPVLYNTVINNTNGVSLSSLLVVKGTLSLTKGVLTTNSKLTINFDNGGNIGYKNTDLGSINGNVNGRRDVYSRSHYMSVPFSGVTSAQINATTPLYNNGYYKMYTKDFVNQNWTAVTNTTTPMPLGTGFSLSLITPAPLILTGTYNHSFVFNGPSFSNVAPTKYFMVANPYPSTIDWDATSGWTKTNVANAIYYWNPANNSVATYIAGVGTNGGTRYIPAMQSVLVSTTGTGGSSSVSMNNDVRSILNSQYFRVASDDIIRLTLIGSDSTNKDEAVIRFNEMATDTFDFDLDAHKILNSGLTPSVYTNSKSEMYSINSYYSIDSAQYIPVGVKLPVDGEYKLKITGNNQDLDYILVDKLLGTQKNIEADSSYKFNGLRTDDVNRFELQLRVSTILPTGVQSANKNSNLGIYSSTKGFVVKTDRYTGENAEIEILDITGNVIETLNKNLSNSTYIPLDMADGAYLVKVNVDGNNFTAMIILSK